MKLKSGPWPKVLPYEIWESIASYLLQEFATIHTQEQLFKGKWYESFPDQDQAREEFLDFEHDVYGRYVEVDGVRYIQQLRNCTRADFDFEDIHRILQMRNGTEEDKIPRDGKPHDRNHPREDEVMIYNAAQHWTKLQKIYVEEDHLGIRQVCFTTANGEPLGEPLITSPGGWWRELRLRGFCWYRTRTDVSYKLYSLLGDLRCFRASNYEISPMSSKKGRKGAGSSAGRVQALLILLST